MELRNKVSIGSSWSVSGGGLQNLLFVRSSSSGVLLDEPLKSNGPFDTSPLLLHPPGVAGDGSNQAPTPCFLYLDFSKLHGYLLQSVELVSESKTIETYLGREEEYHFTSKGKPVPRDEQRQQLYSCVVELPVNTFHQDKISLKLLSLQGRKQVILSKIFVNVTEDHGGVKDEIASSFQSSSDQLLSSLANQNLPPLLKNLVFSLQSMSKSKPEPKSDSLPSSDSTNSSQGSLALPESFLQMADVFRQVHSTTHLPKEVEVGDQGSGNMKGQDSCESNSPPPADDVGTVKQDQLTEMIIQERMYSLEKKLESYIDAKFMKLEQQINVKFEEITSRLMKTLSINGCKFDQDTVETGGTDLQTSVLITED